MPCQKRLDAECFRAHPAWAKQALAYRLLHLITPKEITRRLPKGLRRALLAPGVNLPPGLALPDGTVVAPGTVLPSTWSLGDPVPPGIIIISGTVFPSGWSPGDPLPEGVEIEPGAEFPEGWTPPDPLPPGAIPAPVLPPAAMATGVTPPTYIAPAVSEPASQPARSPLPPSAYWFFEPFDDYLANDWTSINTDGGVTACIDGKLVQTSPEGIGHCTYRRQDTDTWPTNFTVVFSLACVKHETEAGIQLRFRGVELHLYVSHENQIQIEMDSGWVLEDTEEIGTGFRTYTMVVLDDYCQVLMDGVEIVGSQKLKSTGAGNHIYIRLGHNGTGDCESQYEYFGVIEN